MGNVVVQQLRRWNGGKDRSERDEVGSAVGVTGLVRNRCVQDGNQVSSWELGHPPPRQPRLETHQPEGWGRQVGGLSCQRPSGQCEPPGVGRGSDGQHSRKTCEQQTLVASGDVHARSCAELTGRSCLIDHRKQPQSGPMCCQECDRPANVSEAEMAGLSD